MKVRRVLAAALTLVMFTFPPALQVLSEDGGAVPVARGEYSKPDVYEAELKQVGQTFSNFSYNISIPSNATVYSASVDLEGLPLAGSLNTYNCDFSTGDTTNYKAYKGTTSTSSPGNNKPGQFSGQEFTSYDYSAINMLDGSYATQSAYYYYNEWAYHHFTFKVPLDITGNVTVHWDGFGGNRYYSTGGAAVYLWNNGTSSWDLIGTTSGVSVGAVEKTMNSKAYIDQSKLVHVLAICTAGQYYYDINTDYIQVKIDGKVLSWPKNPKMNIGGTGANDWSITEEKFNYALTVADTSLNTKIGSQVANKQSEKVVINIKFLAETSGIIRVSNFKVSYTSPPWCKGIPDTTHLLEDTPEQMKIDLNLWFTDDVTAPKTYDVSWMEDSKKVNAKINTDGHSLDFTLPTKNWWGHSGVRVRAMDTDGLSRESNTFQVYVDPVNDPPVIIPIGNQMAKQGVPFNLTVKARDPDTDLDPAEELTFADNSSLFNIDPVTGVIAFTPAQEQVGTYNIQITVTDREEEMASGNFTLQIQDAEDPPVLDPIPDQTATEDIPFTYTVTATDPDLPYGDALNFSDDSPTFQINIATGEIAFTPTSKDIGPHTVTITVRDKGGMNDSKMFALNVLNSIGNMDRPPSIDPIPNQTAQEGVLFLLVVTASDPDVDLGDSLTYADNSPVFDINPNTGKISFTPAAKDAGTFKVKITVKDRDGLAATAEFWLTVKKTNHPPVLISILPKDGSKVAQNKRIILSAIASDADGDKLNFTWKDGENVLGYGANLTYSFTDTGTYILTLTVSDGKSEQTNETSVEVVAPGGGGKENTPGFEAALAATAIFAAMVGLAAKKRR